MKKKLSVFLCFAAVLFFVSCADLSADSETALKADLPEDFDWQVYAKINKDVASSQIILDIREKNKAFGTGTGAVKVDSAKQAAPNCVNLLANEALAETVYLEYANCPKRGWSQNEKCPGIYANNSSYSVATVSESGDTTWQCNISGCWRGGWDEISEKDAQCTGNAEDDWDKPWCNNIPKPLNVFLQDSLAIYLARTASATAEALTRPTFGAIGALCAFMPKAENPEEVLNYLKNFNYNPTLFQEHYHLIGRADGRPYKYCEQGKIGEEKSQNLSLVTVRNNYYDYGKYVFCLNEADQKIYVIQ